MPKTEDEAVEGPTDAQLFDSILSDDPAPAGDPAPEPANDPEPPEPVAAEATPAEPEPEPEPKGEPEPDDKGDDAADDQKGGYRVPSWRLQEEAEKRRTAEADAKTARDTLEREKAEVAAERRELLNMRRQMAATQQPQGEVPKPPDMLDDPQGFQDHVKTTLDGQLRMMKVNMSLGFAQDQYGDAFNEAYEAMLTEKDKGNRQLVNQIADDPNPGSRLMRWHRERTALSEIGNDFDGYRKKLQDEARKEALNDPEFRKQAIEAWKGEARAPATGDARPGTEVRLPPSLNKATGARSNELSDTTPMSDSELFKHIS